VIRKNIELYDNPFALDISMLNDGLYIVSIQNESGNTFTTKIQVVH